MANPTRTTKNCGLHLLRNATRNFALNSENSMQQKMQPISIKALAIKALERNTTETSFAKLWINNATFGTPKPTQMLHPEQPYFGLKIEQLQILAADDWDEVKDNPNKLKAMVDTYLMLKGLDPEIPSIIYTKTVNCQNCGEIKTWPSCSFDEVPCCQWCVVSYDLILN